MSKPLQYLSNGRLMRLYNKTVRRALREERGYSWSIAGLFWKDAAECQRELLARGIPTPGGKVNKNPNPLCDGTVKADGW